MAVVLGGAGANAGITSLFAYRKGCGSFPGITNCQFWVDAPVVVADQVAGRPDNQQSYSIQFNALGRKSWFQVVLTVLNGQAAFGMLQAPSGGGVRQQAYAALPTIDTSLLFAKGTVIDMSIRDDGKTLAGFMSIANPAGAEAFWTSGSWNLFRAYDNPLVFQPCEVGWGESHAQFSAGRFYHSLMPDPVVTDLSYLAQGFDNIGVPLDFAVPCDIKDWTTTAETSNLRYRVTNEGPGFLNFYSGIGANFEI